MAIAIIGRNTDIPHYVAGQTVISADRLNQTVRRVNDLSRRVIDTTQEFQTRGKGIRWARIQGYSNGNERFMAWVIDGRGNVPPNAVPIEIRVFCGGATKDLQRAIPGVGPGDDIPFIARTVVTLDPNPFFFCLWPFHGTCDPSAGPGASIGGGSAPSAGLSAPALSIEQLAAQLNGGRPCGGCL